MKITGKNESTVVEESLLEAKEPSAEEKLKMKGVMEQFFSSMYAKGAPHSKRLSKGDTQKRHKQTGSLLKKKSAMRKIVKESRKRNRS